MTNNTLIKLKSIFERFFNSKNLKTNNKKNTVGKPNQKTCV